VRGRFFVAVRNMHGSSGAKEVLKKALNNCEV